MRNFAIIFLALLLPLFGISQDITGIWKGSLYNDSTNKTLDYELIISKEKGKYTGLSYTWFEINEKKYFGIKKVKVNVAKDGKIVILDSELIENNYPETEDKTPLQLNILDFSNSDSDTFLSGPFITRKTKAYTVLTGQIKLKRLNSLAQSDLKDYLQKNNHYVSLVSGK